MADQRDAKSLRDIMRPDQPLGPPFTEAQLAASPDVFAQLYDETNAVHRATRSDHPSYIVGRKGAGKTAFLVGGAFADGAEVVLLQSEHVYSEVDRLRKKYSAENGILVADSLVHVWEVLLFHAAMWGVARSRSIPNSHSKQRVFSYICAFGDPLSLEADELLARVSAHMAESLLTAPTHLSFREACWDLEPDRGSLSDVAGHFRKVMDDIGHDRLFVVVDNLEDLHKHLDHFEEIITALFRVSSRALVVPAAQRMPFRTRFAFPAELLPKLRRLAANAEKDFLDYIVVRWTASELIVLAGNRIRTYLDLYHPAKAHTYGLPKQHNHRDRDAAERTLRAVLPADRLTNGLGVEEDPVAYVMRHTQLLPRHLIQILNEIISRRLGATQGSDPRAEATDVLAGVRKAEHRIVEGILTTYSYEYPQLAEALKLMKNHLGLVTEMSRLHEIFNEASVAKSGLDFDDFIQGCLTIGALGIVDTDRGQSAGRYTVGEFAYTFAEDLRPVEDADRLCIHPLFMYRLFDRRSMNALAIQKVRPVYPYGSDPEDEELEI